MKRVNIILFMRNNPNIKITHTLFDNDEYIYQKEDGNIYDEQGYLFEDWYSNNSHNGIRIRVGGLWEDGWYVKIEEDTCKLLSTTVSGKKYLNNYICINCNKENIKHCKYLGGSK